MASSPIYLTILRQGEINLIDLAEVGAVIPRSETHVDDDFLRELTAEIMHLATPAYGRGAVSPGSQDFSERERGAVVQDLQRIGGLIFSHLLTEPARQRLRAASPCDLYLRLDEHLLQLPWELGYDGEQFLATKFRMGRQVITGSPIVRTGTVPRETGQLKVLLIADPTESLPQAATEAEHLCSLLDTLPTVEVTLLGGRDIRKVPLLAALEAHEVVHFAGHSHYNSSTPSKSGWLLHEGILTAGEISKLGRPPLLVFSNSCQAGTTAEWTSGYRYEGQAFGIGSAFLLAGVQHYIGTFWVVHDEESVGFATAFYRSVVAGQSVGEALLEARRETIAQKGWQRLTWASYMLYGDPTFTLLPTTKRDLHSLPPSLDQIAQKQQETTPLPHAQRKWSWWLAQSRFRRRAFPVLVLMVVACASIASILLKRDMGRKPAAPPREGRAALQSLTPGGPLQQSPLPSKKTHQPKAVGVMPFKALRVDPQLEWMQEAIRDNFNGQLSSASDLKIYAKEYIDFLARKEPTTEIEVANRLGVVKMISGSFLATADTLRIEAHIVDVQSGLLEASDHVEGALGDFFNLQAQLTIKLLARLEVTVSPNVTASDPTPPPTSSLDAYKLLLEAEGETTITEPVEADPPPAEKISPNERDPLSHLLPRWMGASSAWAQEAPSRPETTTMPEEEIRSMLEVYRQAYEKKDLHLLDTVYVTLAPAQKEANTKYFQNTQDLRVTISDVDIAVRGTEAVVSYTREDQFVDAKTGQDVKLAVRFTKLLERKDGTWKITIRGK